jgi:hypothetical protein
MTHMENIFTGMEQYAPHDLQAHNGDFSEGLALEKEPSIIKREENG